MALMCQDDGYIINSLARFCFCTNMFKAFLSRFSFYFTSRFYGIVSGIIALFVLAFFVDALMQISSVVLLCVGIALLLDALLLFISQHPVTAERACADRFSNGDENVVTLYISNQLSYSIKTELIDEMPYQFPPVTKPYLFHIKGNETISFSYSLKPLERGEYSFGFINLFLYSPLGLLIRHIKSGENKTVAVYPSFMQMRRYQLLAVANQLEEKGSRQLRKVGSSLEFEQIKEYVPGDDYRTINWQATARKNSLMINTFMDERSQQVICIVDKGRNMKMPFAGMTLLDYAINASLVLSNTVLLKGDKAGLLTYGKTIDQFVVPDKRGGHLSYLLETLYRQQTHFLDSNTEALYTTIRQKIKQRSLLVLFTNFESMYGLQRQLPYLKKIASYHALLVVFFENTELINLQKQTAITLEDIYVKTIANKFVFDKRQMIKELQNAGIMALLTVPQKLTANVINKYIEIKRRQMV